MDTAITATVSAPAPPLAPEILERLVVGGDLAALTPAQRLAYYEHRCRAVGMDPASRPFAYLSLKGKLTLYADKGCAQQLGAMHKLSFVVLRAERLDGDVYVVQGRVTGPDGRSTDDLGAVAVGAARGEELANAVMRARTKAHRRAVLSHCGLGELDESEVASVPGARAVATEAAHREAAPLAAPVAPVAPTADEPPVAAGHRITKPQQKRMFALASARARDLGLVGGEPIVRAVLADCRVEHTADVTAEQYDRVCAAITSYTPEPPPDADEQDWPEPEGE